MTAERLSTVYSWSPLPNVVGMSLAFRIRSGNLHGS